MPTQFLEVSRHLIAFYQNINPATSSNVSKAPPAIPMALARRLSKGTLLRPKIVIAEKEPTINTDAKTKVTRFPTTPLSHKMQYKAMRKRLHPTKGTAIFPHQESSILFCYQDFLRRIALFPSSACAISTSRMDHLAPATSGRLREINLLHQTMRSTSTH